MGTVDDCGATPGEPCRLLPAGLCACCEDEAESETGAIVCAACIRSLPQLARPSTEAACEGPSIAGVD